MNPIYLFYFSKDNKQKPFSNGTGCTDGQDVWMYFRTGVTTICQPLKKRSVFNLPPRVPFVVVSTASVVRIETAKINTGFIDY